MQIFAQQLPKRDSPGVATRQAGSKVADLFPCHYKIAKIMILIVSIQVKGVIPYPRIGKRAQETANSNAVIPYPRVGRSSPDYDY